MWDPKEEQWNLVILRFEWMNLYFMKCMHFLYGNKYKQANKHTLT